MLNPQHTFGKGPLSLWFSWSEEAKENKNRQYTNNSEWGRELFECSPGEHFDLPQINRANPVKWSGTVSTTQAFFIRIHVDLESKRERDTLNPVPYNRNLNPNSRILNPQHTFGRESLSLRFLLIKRARERENPKSETLHSKPHSLTTTF